MDYFGDERDRAVSLFGSISDRCDDRAYIRQIVRIVLDLAGRLFRQHANRGVGNRAGAALYTAGSGEVE